MLDFMRKSANSWLMILLFSVIIFVFALNFGPWAGRGGSTISYAAKVNGHAISISDFNAAYGNQFRMMQQFRPGYTQEQADGDGLKKFVIDRLVGTEILAQVAIKNGLLIPDQLLAKEISTRFSTKDEPFNREQYKRVVNGIYQTTEGQFEEQMRREMLAQRINDLISTGIYVSAEEVKTAFYEKNSRVSLDAIKIKPAFFKVEDIKAQDVAIFSVANKDKIEQYFQTNLKKYRKPKEVHARHVLVKFSTGASAEEKSKAKAKIESARKKIIDQKADFGAVAKEFSEDSTKDNGGDLGFFGPDAMVKPFSDAAFKLKEGEVSDIVETQFGYHLIKAEEVRLPVHHELKDVQDEITREMMKKERQNKAALEYAQKAIEQIRAGVSPSKIKLAGLVVDSAAKSENDSNAPTVLSTGMFNSVSNYIPKIGMDEELRKAAFALTPAQPVGNKAYKVNDDYVVIKLNEREVPKDDKFAEEKESLRSSLESRKGRQFTQDYITYLKSTASITYNEELFSTVVG